MAIEHINDNPQFKAVGEPLKNISKEIGQIDQRQQAVHDELSRLGTASRSDDAWNTYLNENQNSEDQRPTLRAEAEKLGNRKALLQAALERGRIEVDGVQARLSREPCAKARPRYVEQIRRILAAQDEMISACSELRKIRDQIEAAGYRTGSLPPGECNTEFESFRIYIKANYPEIGELK